VPLYDLAEIWFWRRFHRAHETYARQRDIGGPNKWAYFRPHLNTLLRAAGMTVEHVTICLMPEPPDTQSGATDQRYSSPWAATKDCGGGVCG